MQDKVLPIQYFRAIAALMVVMYHAPATMPAFAELFPMLDVGKYGVDIFFVISGFIMARLVDNKVISPREFITKRIVRIAPLYWVTTLFTIALALAAPNLFRSIKVDISTAIQSLLFVPHYSHSHVGQIWPVVVPGWTLNYEMFFYLVFTAAIPLAVGLRASVVTGTFAALACLGLIFDTENAIFEAYTDTIVFEFVLGIFVAHAYKSQYVKSKFVGLILVIAGFVLLALSDGALRGFTKGLPAAMIVSGGLAAFSNIKSKALELLGDASYSTYLTQYFAFGAVRAAWIKLGIGTNSILLAGGYVLACAIACSAVGLMVYLLIEKPMTRKLSAMPRMISNRSRAAA